MTGMFSQYGDKNISIQAMEYIPGKHGYHLEFKFDTNTEWIDKHRLGQLTQRCKICGASGLFDSWMFPDFYNGTLDEFEYFICSDCETLQIKEIPSPETLAQYYGRDYYSLRTPSIKPRTANAVRDDRYILDVGCGTGNWLCDKYAHGGKYLFGCDPFLEKDTVYPNGVRLYKKTVREMAEEFEGEFDLINMSQVFEHVADPLETMDMLSRLLSPNGVISMDFPTSKNIIFDLYEAYSFFLQPPMHLFFYSGNGIAYLAKKAGLRVESVSYGMINFNSFYLSDAHRLGMCYNANGIGNVLDKMEKEHAQFPAIIYETLHNLFILAQAGEQMQVILKH